MAGGQTKFGIPVLNVAQSPFAHSDVGIEGDLAPAIWEGMGNVGQAIANYNPSGYDRPLEAPPGPSTRPEDNPVQALPPAEAAAPEPVALTPEQRLMVAKRKQASGEPLNQGDLMILDEENVLLHPGGKNASSTTSSFSRQVAPTGAVWEDNQAALTEAKVARDKIRAQQVQTAHDLSMAQAEHAQQSVRMADAQANELTKLGAQQEKATADYKAKLDQTMADQEKANTAYRKAAADYDPSRLMHGGQGVLASLALALGAFGSTLNHSQNNVPQLVENAINRDLDKQKTGIAAKKEQVTWLDKVMAGNRSRFSDENAARLMTRANAKEVYAAQYQSMAAKLGGAERVAQAKDHVAEINMSGQQDREHALRLQEAAERAQAGQRATQTTTSQADTIVRPGDYIARSKGAAETEKLLREVGGGPKLSPADQAFTNKQLGSLAELAASSKGLKDLEGQRAKSNPISRALGVGEGGKQNVAEEVQAQKYGRAISGTASSEPEHERIKGVVRGGAFSIFDEAKNRGPEQLRSSAVEEARAKFMSIPDAAKPGVAARLTKLGFEPDEIEKIVSDAGPVDYSQQVAAHGGR